MIREPTWLDALNDWKVKSRSKFDWIGDSRRGDDNKVTHIVTPVLTCTVYERPSEDIQMRLRRASSTPLEALNGVKSAVQARLGKKLLLDIYGIIEDNKKEGAHNRFSVTSISFTYKLENWPVTEYKSEGSTKREAQQAAAEKLLRGARYCMFVQKSNRT
ncbi:unnamed protein product [Rhizoctonia solani]|uniref:Uncharacterized protein n=1 Tax=Rhizoctonia solani TaxID=456999 RepID=A0A8H3CK95_9AGAM|nr:unnamed protein product [Rhizoctonia solani]